MDKNIEDKYTLLRSRMDADMNLYYLEQYVMTDTNGAEIPGTDSITLNDPRTFADACMAVMGNDKRLFEVTDIDVSEQRKIELAYNAIFDHNDEILQQQLIEPLGFAVDFFACLRGWLGGLVLMYKDGDKYCPSITPIDPRWMTWEMGARGLKWASYKIRMDRKQAEETYKKSYSKNKSTIEFDVIWDEAGMKVVETIAAPEDVNQNAVVKYIPHNLGFCPIIVMPVPTQPILIATVTGDYSKALSYQGESIYSANRDLYPKMNEFASVWASINKQQFLTPLAYVGNREAPERPFGIGVVVKLEPDEQLIEIPTKEMSTSAQALFGQLTAKIQQGSLSAINYGQLSFELSALAVAQLKDERDKIFVPRRKAKVSFYKRACKMLRRQLQGNCYNTDIPDDDAIDNLDVSLFKEKFSINITFRSISPEENIANYNLAQLATVVGRPKEKILREILRVPDPEGEIRQAKLENAEAQIPELGLYNMAIALAPGEISEEKVRETESKIIFWYLDRKMKGMDMQMGQVPQPASQPKYELGINRPQSEKIAAEKAKRTGMAQGKSGIRAQAEV